MTPMPPSGRLAQPLLIQAKAKAVPQPVVQQQSIDQKFKAIIRTLKSKDAVVQGDWVRLKPFLNILQLPSHHTDRYLNGSTCWRLGRGAGRKLTINTDYCTKAGKRGGSKAPHVKAIILKEVLSKYY